MAKKYLDYDGLLYFLQQIRPNAAPIADGTASVGEAKKFALQDHVHPSDTTKADKSSTVTNVAWDSTNKKITKTINGSTTDVVTTSTIKSAIGSATSSNEGLMTTAQVSKLSGIAAGAEVNQNAFSNVKVGTTTIAADGKTDTLELAAGTNITLTPDATNDKVTIAFNGTIPTVPNNFGTVKVGSTRVVADTTSDTLELVAGSNVTLTPDATNDKVTIAATDTTYSDATTSTHGLMSATDKTKLDELIAEEVDIAAGDNILLSHSNGVVTITAVDTTYSDVVAGGDSGLMTGADKTKLNGIAAGAEVNQNAFGNVKVGSTTIAADGKTDTLEFVAGSNVTLTPDASGDKITIAATDTKYTPASANPLMDGTAAVGTSAKYAREDHVHPKDTSKANLASPTFTGTPKAPTASAGTNTTQIATTAFVQSAINTAITGAASFQGTAPTSFAPTGYKKGWYWVVGTAGTYAGEVCEPGDMIFAINDYGSAYAASDFNVIQTNLDITSITNAEIDTIVAS